MYDFRPFDPSGQATWGGAGLYSAATSTPMRASIEVPAGSLVRDVEYYVYNSSGSAVGAATYLYVPGSGTISSIGAEVSVPSTGAVTATRTSVNSSWQGPYPLGSLLMVSITTPTNASVQVNGARVGFSAGAAATGLLDAPVRAYDSRTSGGKIATGSTRTITLPASVVLPGTSGVLVNITAVGATSVGNLKVYSAAAAEPAASAINYAGNGSAIANAMIVGVSADRKIKIKASKSVHVIVDVTGTVA